MSRRDSRDRQEFREYVRDNIDQGRSPSFEVFTNDQGGWHDWSMEWRDQEGQVHEFGKPGFHSNEGNEPGWFDTSFDAGHTTSSAANRDAYAIEDRSSNRSEGALFEREGIVLEKPAVEIEHQSVNRELAERMEDRGLLQEGIVDQAPFIEGWTRNDGIVGQNQDASLQDLFHAELAPDPQIERDSPTNDVTRSNETEFAFDLQPDPFESSLEIETEVSNVALTEDFLSENADLAAEAPAWEDGTATNDSIGVSDSSWDIEPDNTSPETDDATDASRDANQDASLSESDSFSEAGHSDTSSADFGVSAEGTGSDADGPGDGADGGD